MEEAEDPMLLLKKEDQAIEREKIQKQNQEKMTKLTNDMKIHDDKQELEEKKISSTEGIEGAKIGASIAKDHSKSELESGRIASGEKVSGAKLGTDIARTIMDNVTKEKLARDAARNKNGS